MNKETYSLTRLRELCSRSEKSEYDIRKKLIEWNFEANAEKIINKLKEEKYIDNLRFAKAFANDKIKLNKWGKYKIKLHLKSKGISDNHITDALSSIDYDEYRKIIYDELVKKKKSLKITDSYKLKAKIFSFGSQRGYESEIISEFLSDKDNF